MPRKPRGGDGAQRPLRRAVHRNEPRLYYVIYGPRPRFKCMQSNRACATSFSFSLYRRAVPPSQPSLSFLSSSFSASVSLARSFHRVIRAGSFVRAYTSVCVRVISCNVGVERDPWRKAGHTALCWPIYRLFSFSSFLISVISYCVDACLLRFDRVWDNVEWKCADH